jgi:tetratricopeptide (TPR) repeat protein
VTRRLRLARYWHATGDLDQAGACAGRAWQQVRSRRGQAIPALLAADVALTLAQIERDRDDYAAGLARLHDALELLGPAAGSADGDRLTAWALAGLGDCHRRAARYSAAAQALTRALRLAGEHPGPTAAAMTSLGIMAKDLGSYDEAAHWYARVAALHQAAGVRPGDAATLQHNLAGLEYARARYPRAESHARRALALRRQAPDATDVDVATDLAVLAAAVARQQRPGEARDMLTRALSACHAARPPRRHEIAVHLHGLAGIEHASGHPAAAESLYRQALRLRQELLGPDHPEVALVSHNLGVLLRDQHRDDEAADCLTARAGEERHRRPADRLDRR